MERYTMIKSMKQTGLLLLLTLLVLPLAAQERIPQGQTDTAYVFRFMPEKDVLYVPFKANNPELERLCAVLDAHRELLQAGKMYISVSSYAASGSVNLSAERMAYLRNSRVKSELITRAGLKESYFVTDRYIGEPYHGEHNVVVVVVPASIAKVSQIAGAEAAETVRTYYREMEQAVRRESDEAKATAEKSAREAAAREEAARRAEEERLAAEAQQKAKQAEAQRQRLAAEELARQQAEAATAKPYTLALRANLLRWATLTPDLGVEWRITRNWGILVDGTWTSWSWDNRNRRYALWEVSPAIHYYIGKEKQGYVGAMYHTGAFNYKLSHTGKQGDLQGGGIVGGYRLPIGKGLLFDFNLGVGYTRADYEKYTLIDDVRVRRGNEVKNYWGINQAGVTLVWKLF